MVIADYESDQLTKNLSRTLFYRHIEYIMGTVVPVYVYIPTSKDIMPCATKDKAIYLGTKHGRVV